MYIADGNTAARSLTMAKAWNIAVFRDGFCVHSVTIKPGSALWTHAVAQCDHEPTNENVVESATTLVMEAFAADESVSKEVMQ